MHAFQTGRAVAEDGVFLHWEMHGDGIPLICSNGVGVSTFFWKYIVEQYSTDFAVVLWDCRGHGQSDRNLDPHKADMSIERHAKDLQHVLSDAFPEYDGPVLLIGHSMGCQVNLEAYRSLQNRVLAIFHLLGTAGNALSTFGGVDFAPYVFRAVRRITFKLEDKANHIARPLLLSRISWPFANKLALVDPLYTKYEDFRPYVEHLATLDMRLFMRAIWGCQEHSAWDLLPNIHCPVLVIAAERDGFTPISCAQKIANQIPNASLVVLADGSHAALIEQPEVINYQINKVLRQIDLL